MSWIGSGWRRARIDLVIAGIERILALEGDGAGRVGQALRRVDDDEVTTEALQPNS